MARYLRFHPLDMLTDPDDPLPDSLVALVSMTNAEMTDRQPPATLPTTEAMSTATTAWLARRPREIVIPVSMIDDPQVAVWRSAGHTITTRAV